MMAIRFSEEDVRPMGRTARGVRAIKLKKEGDAVVGMVVPTKKHLTYSLFVTTVTASVHIWTSTGAKAEVVQVSSA